MLTAPKCPRQQRHPPPDRIFRQAFGRFAGCPASSAFDAWKAEYARCTGECRFRIVCVDREPHRRRPAGSLGGWRRDMARASAARRLRLRRIPVAPRLTMRSSARYTRRQFAAKLFAVAYLVLAIRRSPLLPASRQARSCIDCRGDGSATTATRRTGGTNAGSQPCPSTATDLPGRQP